MSPKDDPKPRTPTPIATVPRRPSSVSQPPRRATSSLRRASTASQNQNIKTAPTPAIRSRARIPFNSPTTPPPRLRSLTPPPGPPSRRTSQAIPPTRTRSKTPPPRLSRTRSQISLSSRVPPVPQTPNLLARARSRSQTPPPPSPSRNRAAPPFPPHPFQSPSRSRARTPPLPPSQVQSRARTPPPQPERRARSPSPDRKELARKRFQDLLQSANKVLPLVPVVPHHSYLWGSTSRSTAILPTNTTPLRSLYQRMAPPPPPFTIPSNHGSKQSFAINKSQTFNIKPQVDIKNNNDNSNANIPFAVAKNINVSSGPSPSVQLVPGPGVGVGLLQKRTLSLQAMERNKNLRNLVEKAIQDRKLFYCVGVYPAIKNALKKRGWVEKTGHVSAIRGSSNGHHHRLDHHGPGEEESDAQWMARVLREHPPDFIWVIRRDNIDWRNLHKDQVINRFPKAPFTTKVGLSACLQHIHWFTEPGVAETYFPRCYRLSLEEELKAFQEDYRLTAAMSFLRFVVETYPRPGGPSALMDPGSRVTPLAIDFAARQVGNFIRMRRHEDVDWLVPPNSMTQHWEAFLFHYRMVVHEKKGMRFEDPNVLQAKYELAKMTMNRVAHYWPQGHLDGFLNMWIVKPGAKSRGKGIVILNHLDRILDIMNQGNARESNWVVQKYMERPLLVYKTKFDIRQWFIITDWSPLTLWFYKESYIRFCTKPFVLEDFHESIHLCNNAIQCRYQNAQTRDRCLPEENMWDCYTFQAYLKSIGQMDMWPKIYAGMKQAILGVLLASQDSVEPRRGCFELYGADFMLAEDFVPWLIEINSCPCMAATTSITARMCAQCLEDTIKVVVDRKQNRNVDTGMFELAFKQSLAAVNIQPFSGHDFLVQGKRLTKEGEWAGSSTKGSGTKKFTTPLIRSPIPVPEQLTFADLLDKLRSRNAELFQRGYISSAQIQAISSAVNLTSNQRSPEKTSSGSVLSGHSPGGSGSKDGTEILEAATSKNSTNSSTTYNSSFGGENKDGVKSATSASPTKSGIGVVGKKEPDATLAHLSKYFDEGSSTFQNLVKIGRSIDEETKKKEGNLPASIKPPGFSLADKLGLVNLSLPDKLPSKSSAGTDIASSSEEKKEKEQGNCCELSHDEVVPTATANACEEGERSVEIVDESISPSSLPYREGAEKVVDESPFHAEEEFVAEQGNLVNSNSRVTGAELFDLLNNNWSFPSSSSSSNDESLLETFFRADLLAQVVETRARVKRGSRRRKCLGHHSNCSSPFPPSKNKGLSTFPLSKINIKLGKH